MLHVDIIYRVCLRHKFATMKLYITIHLFPAESIQSRTENKTILSLAQLGEMSIHLF